jgi:hypothetical protein
VGILAKRLYGKYLSPKSEELTKRIQEVKDGVYKKEFEEMMKADKDDLTKKYYARDTEE